MGVTKPKPKDEDVSTLRPNNSHPRKVETSKAAGGPKHFETLAKISLKTDKLLITPPQREVACLIRFASATNSSLRAELFLVDEDLQNKSLNSKDLESVVISLFRRS